MEDKYVNTRRVPTAQRLSPPPQSEGNPRPRPTPPAGLPRSNPQPAPTAKRARTSHAGRHPAQTRISAVTKGLRAATAGPATDGPQSMPQQCLKGKRAKNGASGSPSAHLITDRFTA
eukprot:7148767-Pyramimonas_sp.AAC.1